MSNVPCTRSSLQGFMWDLLAVAPKLLLEGSRTGWWGLSCPSHCQGGFSILLSVAFGAFLLGVILTVLVFRQILLSPQASATLARPPAPGSPSPRQPPVPRAQARLRGYLHE